MYCLFNVLRNSAVQCTVSSSNNIGYTNSVYMVSSLSSTLLVVTTALRLLISKTPISLFALMVCSLSLYSVVCHQLGFGDAVRAYTIGHLRNRSTSMPIWLNKVRCTASNHYLSECYHNGWGSHDCSHSQDVGVTCNSTSMLQVVLILVVSNIILDCTEGDIRLVGGSNVYEGRVEVCHNDVWRAVCDDGQHGGWGRNNGIVACRQLGYLFVRVDRSGSFGQGKGQIRFYNSLCRGTESQLIECGHNRFNYILLSQT